MADKTPRHLGDLFFYSIPDHLEVPAARLHQLAQQSNLPTPWLPKAVTPLCAFKRAAQQLGAQRATRVLGAGHDETLIQTTVYIRDSPRNHQLRHIIKEIRRGTDKPEYLILGTVEFRDGLHFTCTTTEPGQVRDYDAMRTALQGRYTACQSVYGNKDLQRVMSRAMRDLHALPLRSSGAVFFIPLANRAQLRGLAKFLDQLGGDSDTFAIHNTPLEAERLACKLQQTLAHEVQAIESRLHEMRLQGYLPACRIRGFQSNLEWCRQMSQTYAAILAADLAPAHAVLQKAESVVANAVIA